MKKFLTMFAFVAAIVFGAFTLASCGGDDDDKYNKEQKYSFTFEAEINSTKPETLNAPDWPEAKADFARRFKESSQKFNVVGTNLDGDMAWMDYINSTVYSTLTKEMDDLAKKHDDLTMSVTVRLMKNGKDVHQEKTHKAWF